MGLDVLHNLSSTSNCVALGAIINSGIRVATLGTVSRQASGYWIRAPSFHQLKLKVNRSFRSTGLFDTTNGLGSKIG